MKIETFILEREQSLWENEVKYNLSESGVHPGSINNHFSIQDIDDILNTELTYGFTQGSPELRQNISQIYSNIRPDNILVTNGSAEANFISILTHLSAGDELIYMVPNYLQIQGIARAIGVEVKHLKLKEKLNWNFVPLIDLYQAPISSDLNYCIRILLLVNSNKSQEELSEKFQYLKNAKSLREN